MLRPQDSLQGGDLELRLRGALLIYYSKLGGCLVTCHDVHGSSGTGELTIGAGHPITREQANLLVSGVQGSVPIRTVLPANVLMWDGVRVAWHVPARRRRIWFDRRQQPGLQHVSRQEVWQPALLFVAEPSQLFVYALASDERPTAETLLFQAPYLNVYGDGNVCAGAVEWPGTVDVSQLPEWERRWFESEGTHVTARRLTLFPGGHHALWEAMLTADHFPGESLVPTGQTVLDAINRQGPPELGPLVPEEIVPVKGALK